MQKKKSSYDAKKEKLINIKEQLEEFYENYMPSDRTNIKHMILNIRYMQLTLDLIWEIVKDEKTK